VPLFFPQLLIRFAPLSAAIRSRDFVERPEEKVNTTINGPNVKPQCELTGAKPALAADDY